MSPEEETLFQQHLEKCNQCRAYIDSIRRLSCLIADEELAYTQAPPVRKPEKRKMMLWSFVSIAACILLIGGIFINVSNNGVSDHKTSVNRRVMANKEEIELRMIFPGKEVETIRKGDVLVFKWSREANYKLVVRNGRQIVIEARGESNHYTPNAGRIKGFHVLNWTLILDGKEFKGKIYFNNN
ncbi:MAG: hypothetical protein LBH58_14115 [Tannerellaceae bacterium]|jgi:hypothetical protein|nr:hypothetical protein [Tannerellaceae bacterium]